MAGYSHKVGSAIYYLHKRGPLYFFSSKIGNINLPSNMRVMVNSKTGLPYVKKK